MSYPRLKRARILANNGLQLTHVNHAGTRLRFVRPGGAVLMREAALALGTYYMLLDRMAAAGRLKRFKRDGVWMVPVTEVLRLRKAWHGRPATARTEAS